MATTSHNPFMDFTKIAGQFKMPNFGADALIEAQRKNIEAVTAANRIALEGVQALTQRQVEIVRQAWDESASAVEKLSAAGKPEEKLAKQAELAKQVLEHGLANLRELTEMGAKSNSEAAELISQRVVEGFDEMKAEIEKLNVSKK
jgi:phasin family protein